MLNLRSALFAGGLLIQILGTFLESPDPGSWQSRKVAYRYIPALAGYQRLISSSLAVSTLSVQDQGFAELLEIVMASAPQISQSRVAVIRLAGFNAVPSTGIYVECLDAGGQKLHATSISYPEVEIQKRFYDRPLLRARSVLFWVGLTVSGLVYIFEVRERRGRAQPTALE